MVELGLLLQGGGTCGCTPGVSDIVYIESNVVLNKNLTGGSAISGTLDIGIGASLKGSTYSLLIKASATFVSYGELEVYDLTFSNGSVVIQSMSTTHVFNDFENKNNSNIITIDGTMQVDGDFDNGNGGVISGSGTIEVDGTRTNTGETFGCIGVDCCYGDPCVYNEFTPIQSIATGDFNVASTWNCDCVPGTDNKIVVDQGHTVTIVANTEVAGVDIDTNGVLELSNLSLTLNEVGFWNAGSFNGATGSLLLTGSVGEQFITNEATFEVSELTVNNADGVDLSGSSVDVFDLVTVSSGTLTTNGVLSLKSTVSRTASIAELAGGASISGGVVAERFIPAGTRSWWHISSPINGLTVSDWGDDFPITGDFTGADDLGGSNLPSIYWYDETHVDVVSDSGWTAFPTSDLNETVVQGRGYRAFLRTDGSTTLGDTVVDMAGTINSGNISLPVSYTNPSSPAGDDAAGWNFVGNPYPSNIDWATGTWTKTNLEDAIYVWDPSGSYTAFVDGASVNGGVSRVAQGQGFWVRANAASPVLTITESCKTNTATTFLRTPGVPEDAVSISIVDGDDRSNTVLRFKEEATEGFDSKYDATYLGGSYPVNITSYKLDYSEWYAVNSTPSNEDRVIPIWVIHPGDKKTYELQFDVGELLDGTGQVILIDYYLGDEVEVYDGMIHEFEYDGSWASNGGSRFEIMYRASTITSVDDILSSDEISILPNPVKAGEAFGLAGCVHDAEAEVYSVTGEYVSKIQIECGEAIQSELLNPGYYFLHAVHGEFSNVSFVVE